MTDGVIVRKTDDIIEITLNSPERGNGMTDDQIVFLGDVLEREHANARLIVLRANGADFCMGRAHLGPRPTGLPEALQLRRMHDIVFRTYGAVRHSKAPVVSVVKGRAYGFGCALASVCDITIAEESARFAINEMNNNIMPTMVMSSLIDRVPLKALMYMVWTAKEIDARHAMSIGAVSEVVPAGEADRRQTRWWSDSGSCRFQLFSRSRNTRTARTPSTSARRSPLRAACTRWSTRHPKCGRRRRNNRSGPRLDAARSQKSPPSTGIT